MICSLASAPLTASYELPGAFEADLKPALQAACASSWFSWKSRS